jgi:hypothetical protein
VQIDSLEKSQSLSLEQSKVPYVFNQETGELKVTLRAFKIASFAVYDKI